jgi:hypothetical protein
MLDMQAWQYVPVAVVGVISIGWMSFAIVRLFTRPASAKATVREATAVESGLTGATIPEGARVFDAWSYRVGARFAGRIRIAVYDERVAVAGPRVPRMLYQMWIWIQGLLLALVLPGIVTGAVTLDWRWIVAAVAVLVVSFCVSMGGAGLWPGLGELFVTKEGHFFALEFPRASVNQVDIGKGWSKGGLEVVLFPYKAGIDKMAGQRAVSFFAPDEHGREVRFAMELHTETNVRELAGMLGGIVTGESA